MEERLRSLNSQQSMMLADVKQAQQKEADKAAAVAATQNQTTPTSTNNNEATATSNSNNAATSAADTSTKSSDSALAQPLQDSSISQPHTDSSKSGSIDNQNVNQTNTSLSDISQAAADMVDSKLTSTGGSSLLADDSELSAALSAIVDSEDLSGNPLGAVSDVTPAAPIASSPRDTSLYAPISPVKDAANSTNMLPPMSSLSEQQPPTSLADALATVSDSVLPSSTDDKPLPTSSSVENTTNTSANSDSVSSLPQVNHALAPASQPTDAARTPVVPAKPEKKSKSKTKKPKEPKPPKMSKKKAKAAAAAAAQAEQLQQQAMQVGGMPHHPQQGMPPGMHPQAMMPHGMPQPGMPPHPGQHRMPPPHPGHPGQQIMYIQQQPGGPPMMVPQSHQPRPNMPNQPPLNISMPAGPVSTQGPMMSPGQQMMMSSPRHGQYPSAPTGHPAGVPGHPGMQQTMHGQPGIPPQPQQTSIQHPPHMPGAPPPQQPPQGAMLSTQQPVTNVPVPNNTLPLSQPQQATIPQAIAPQPIAPQPVVVPGNIATQPAAGGLQVGLNTITSKSYQSPMWLIYNCMH